MACSRNCSTARALLEDKGRWSERELRLAAVAAPGDPERVLQYALIITGALLVVVMLFFPSGIVIALARELPKRGLFGRRKGHAA